MGFTIKQIGKPHTWMTWFLLFAAQAFTQTVTLTVHLYSPWAADPKRNALPAFIEMSGSGAPIPFRDNIMVAEGSDWYKATITYTGTQDANKHHAWGFVNFIPNTNFRWSDEQKYGKDGTIGGPSFNLGDVFFAKNWTEVWIIPQGVGVPPIIQDYPPAKKVMMFFNPWPQAAPTLKQGPATTYSAMRLPEGPANTKCGWYVHYFRDSAYTVHFKHIRTAATFGQGGLNSPAVINLTDAFKTADTVYVYQEFTTGGPAKVSGQFPSDRSGTCGYKLAMTIRDFSREHPDFERGAHGGKPGPFFGDAGVIKDMVNPVLDPVTKKPTQGTRSFFQTKFPDWFNTNTATETDPKLKNYEVCKDLDVLKDGEGYWTYSSLHQNPAKGFFPINDFNKFGETYTSGYNDNYDRTKFAFNPPEIPKQNFHFCMEMHADFKYEKGQNFSFIGDDDVWVFINNKMAIDLGGPHSPERASVSLDTLKLTEGNKYNFDLFYCERSTSGSNLYIQTSIFFEQSHSLFAERTVLADGSVKYIIKEKIVTGGGYCGSTGTDSTVVVAPSRFTLTGPGLATAVELTTTHYGGIVVNPAKTEVNVDTAKIKGLKPGIFTITYISNSTGQSNILQFEVPVTLLPQLDKPVANPPGRSTTTLAPAEVITLTAPAGATILYTLDGSTPDTVAGPLTKVYSTALTLPATGTTVLKAIAVKTEMAPSEVMTETYVRTVPPAAETPVATPKGTRFIEPLSVTLVSNTATIYYTLDGTEPATAAGGSTKVYSGPIPLTQSTTIKAIATVAGLKNSGIMTEAYTYAAPVAIKGGWVLDKNGDGIIESAVVEFASNLTLFPDRLVFKILGADGQMYERDVKKSEISLAAGPSSRVTVNFSTPLPFGVTSVSAAGSVGQVFRQEDIPMLAGTFPLADSVAPVIIKAEVFPVDSLNPMKRVVLTFSEPVAISATPGASLIFKRDDAVVASNRIVIARSDKPDGTSLILFIDSTSEVFPIVGDYVAVGGDGGIKDLAGNAPGIPLFRKLEGKVPVPTPSRIYVTFADGTNTAGPGSRPGAEPTSPPSVLFIPVDGKAVALPGNTSDGKCTGCFAGSEGNFVGPVVHLEVPGVSTFELKIFNNLGEFVASGKGAILESDLRLLTPVQGGTKYVARIVWTGRTSDGRKAGTGAYVLSAVVRSDKDMKSGAPASVGTRQIRFGMLRTQSGS